MAWVRSFKKNRHHRRRRRNPYTMPGVVALANRRRRRHKRNPSRARAYATKARGFLGLPPVMPIVYASGGFVATAAIQGFITPMLPATWTKNADGTPNLLGKYAVLLGSLIGTTWISKMVLGAGTAALAGIGGGIYIVSQVAHDFAPNTIPGMGMPLQLAAYGGVYRPSLSNGNGGMRNYESSLRAPDFGAQNTTNSAGQGGMNIVSTRFRRFQ